MKEIIKNLSFKSEFLIVISLCFGYSILVSLIVFLTGSFNSSGAMFTNETLISTVIYEILLLVLVYNFLVIRENQPDLSNNTKLVKTISIGILLVLANYLVSFLLTYTANTYFPGSIPDLVIDAKLNPGVILIISLANPIYEEVIVAGYVITSLSQRNGSLYALNTSILIRFLYHLYQGPVAALYIIPMGIMFGFVYLKWRNIWPLIIAHAIMDFIAFYQF